ncbi:LytR C-terminal domain-containing protein [Qaidamihabitans albus]|uniref:LytR C-terminal domain-containing protein n=1 Tax=Qaidamihabitans albus TaxID=2795733 RepID=UPI0018F21FA6|nr:LytR C-terminal domain-containing protein [Qaidamihabitans albus]
MSIFDGLSRPTRAAGLGLLAVAVVAAAIGGVTLLTGDGGDDTAAPETSETSEPSEPQPPGSPTGTQPGPTSEPAPTTTEDTEQPGEASPTGTETAAPGEPGNGTGDGDADGDGTAEDQQASMKAGSVRVYNNSNIRGLATDAGGDFRAEGWNVVETGNYSDGIIPTTTAYFRPGTGEEAAARALAREFGMRAEPRFAGIADSSPGVIVIVTKDYRGASDGK